MPRKIILALLLALLLALAGCGTMKPADIASHEKITRNPGFVAGSPGPAKYPTSTDRGAI